VGGLFVTAFIAYTMKWIRRIQYYGRRFHLSTLSSSYKTSTYLLTICYASRATDNLDNMGYLHEMVNHQIEFVNINGATTNHIEAYWSRVKRRMKYLYGSQGELQWSHLDEVQYRMWFHWTNATVFANFANYIDHVRVLYPV
jgi:hypothetical protein